MGKGKGLRRRHLPTTRFALLSPPRSRSDLEAEGPVTAADGEVTEGQQLLAPSSVRVVVERWKMEDAPARLLLRTAAWDKHGAVGRPARERMASGSGSVILAGEGEWIASGTMRGGI